VQNLKSDCPGCGRPRAADDRFCAQCGRAFETQTVLPSNVDAPALERTPTWRAVQSPLLVGALVIATFNLYGMWWLGRTWWQLKQEDGDAGKHPVWHALSMLVPIYGYFRFYAHMRGIVGVAATPEARAALQPGAMTVAWIVVNVLGGTAGARVDVPASVLVLAIALSGALLGWAQHGLNAAWRSLPGGVVSARAHPLHWLLLVIGLFLYTAALLLPESEG